MWRGYLNKVDFKVFTVGIVDNIIMFRVENKIIYEVFNFYQDVENKVNNLEKMFGDVNNLVQNKEIVWKNVHRVVNDKNKDVEL